MMTSTPKIAIIGFGEAGCAFTHGWSPQNLDINVFDIKTNNNVTRPAMLKKYTEHQVTGCDTIEQTVADVDLIFSFVTADQAHAAAKSVVGHCPKSALFFDCNSCAPDTKRASAILINDSGGRYVDVAVMAPVHPSLHQTKVHICGPDSSDALIAMEHLSMNVTVMDGDIGTASATKMVRSIMMKGLEATMIECVLAGRRAGVDELVLDSLEKTYPGFGFREKAAYMMERVMVHGNRRAAEMREVAITIDDLGLDNRMAKATVEWQQKIGELNLDPNYNLGAEDYQLRADIILEALEVAK